MAVEQKLPGLTATGTGREPAVAGVALFSEQPAELVAFYEKVARVPFTHRQHDDGREHWIATVSGGVQVEIKALLTAGGDRTPDAASTDAGGVSRSEISFRVSGVAGAAARAITSGGRSLQRAETHDWGTFAVVLDPDGNRLGLFEPPVHADTSTPHTTEGAA